MPSDASPADQRLAKPVMGRSIRTARWRYTDWAEGNSGVELYDHAADPLDHNDVTADHPDVVERLTAELVGRLRYVEARKLPTDEDVSEGLSPAELRRLRSLGYIR